MNLICPHCQKTVAVADELGGQTTRCSHCGGPFTVPLPPAPPPPPEIARTVPLKAVQEPQSNAGTRAESIVSSSYRGELRPQFAVTLHPEVVRWTVPGCLLLMFIFLFFPWISSPLEGKYAFTQTGFGAAFGYAEPTAEPSLRPAPWVILFFLVVLAGVLASVGLTAHRFLLPRTSVTLPPIVDSIANHRTYVLGTIALLAFLFLGLQMVMGFSAEAKDFTAAVPEHFKDVPKDFDQIMKALLHRTVWLKMTFTLSLIGVLAALADFWLERRPNRPPPRLVAEW